jgi:hypothetical protein
LGRNLHSDVKEHVKNLLKTYPVGVAVWSYKLYCSLGGDVRTYAQHLRKLAENREPIDGKKLHRLPDPAFVVVPLEDPFPAIGEFPLLDTLQRAREFLDEVFPNLSHIATLRPLRHLLAQNFEGEYILEPEEKPAPENEVYVEGKDRYDFCH